MDEMNVLTELRRDIPTIDDDAVRAARRRLYAEMNDRSSGRVQAFTWRTLAVGGLAVALIAGIAIAQNVGGDRAPDSHVGVLPGQRVAEAAALADGAVKATAARPDEVLQPNTWTYVKDLQVEADGGPIGPRSTRTTSEDWYTAGGTRGAVFNNRGKVNVYGLDPRDAPNPGFLLGASADPAKLRERVYAEVDRIIEGERTGKIRSVAGVDTSRGRDVAAFQLVGEVLRQYYVTPRHQAGLYSVLSYIPGVQVLASSVDAAGRRGKAFAVTDSQSVRSEIIIDAGTYQYLGSRAIFTRDWAESPPEPGVFSDSAPLRVAKGTVIGWNAKLASAIVAAPGDRPQTKH